MEKLTKTHLAHGVEKTENLSQYDDSIKVLLSDKQVLARIAQHRIEEFRDYDITTDNYDGLKKVYSIWIFFDAPVKDSDTITEYTIEKKDVYGTPVEGAKYDYLSISFIRLPKGNMEESKNKLIHMLTTLFSQKLDADAKKKILEQEHQMKMTRKLEGGIHSMCNVGEGLWEKAVESGLQQGINQERQTSIDVLIRNLRKFGVDDSDILTQLMEEYDLDEKTAKSYL